MGQKNSADNICLVLGTLGYKTLPHFRWWCTFHIQYFRPHIYIGLNSNPNLTNVYLLFTSGLKYESTIGSQGDTTELLHKDSSGSKVGPGRVWALQTGASARPTGALPSGFLTYWKLHNCHLTELYVRNFIRATARHTGLLFVYWVQQTYVYKPHLPMYMSCSQTWKHDLVPTLFITSAMWHDYGWAECPAYFYCRKYPTSTQTRWIKVVRFKLLGMYYRLHWPWGTQLGFCGYTCYEALIWASQCFCPTNCQLLATPLHKDQLGSPISR